MNQSPNKKYDLEERTAIFAEEVIRILKKVQITPINKRIIDQLVGSAGSLGANYSEANEAESKNDFIHKIGICKKEAKETKHWLRLIIYTNPEFKTELNKVWKENHELLLIFSKIIKTSRNKLKIK